MRSGLDSPPVVDHVRRNVPTGSGCLGRLLDRHFLSSLPARTLRMRAANLEQAIRAASVRLRTTGLPVRILDLAAGDGCQVGEAVRRPAPAPHAAPISGSGGDSVTRTQGVAQGHDGTRSACVPAPQSDEHATASPASCATLAIARLHDLVQQPPHAVQSMLTEFARAVPPGGCLILTAGPHQPGWQRHAVALGTPAQGDLPPPGAAWCLADLDRLVASAGFELHDRWVDDWGVFSVSLCVRAGAEAMMRGLVAR
jgi:hypothetical protein